MFFIDCVWTEKAAGFNLITIDIELIVAVLLLKNFLGQGKKFIEIHLLLLPQQFIYLRLRLRSPRGRPKLLHLDQPIFRLTVIEQPLDTEDLLLVETLIHVFIDGEISRNLHLSGFSVTHSNNIMEFLTLCYKRICRYNETHRVSTTLKDRSNAQLRFWGIVSIEQKPVLVCGYFLLKIQTIKQTKKITELRPYPFPAHRGYALWLAWETSSRAPHPSSRD